MRFRDRLIDQRLRDLEEKKDIGRIDLLQTFLEARTEEGKPLDMEYIRQRSFWFSLLVPTPPELSFKRWYITS